MSKVPEWSVVCQEKDVSSDIGVCVSVSKEQIAIFKDGKDNRFYAISNYDPNSKANVLSRGIVGSVGEKLVVASPIYKQHFCLVTGECLETGESIKTYPVRVENGELQVALS